MVLVPFIRRDPDFESKARKWADDNAYVFGVRSSANELFRMVVTIEQRIHPLVTARRQRNEDAKARLYYRIMDRSERMKRMLT